MLSRTLRSERGVGLMEVIVATIIAVIAVVALAYSFGMGRGLVNQYEVARMALAAGQRRMEVLSTLPAGAVELAIGSTHTRAVQVDGQTVARETWTVTPYTDPASGHAAGSADLKQVTVTVTWGRGSFSEILTLTRLFPTS